MKNCGFARRACTISPAAGTGILTAERDGPRSRLDEAQDAAAQSDFCSRDSPTGGQAFPRMEREVVYGTDEDRIRVSGSCNEKLVS